MLDTESGSAGDLLYRSCGWTEYGRVPSHAFRPEPPRRDHLSSTKQLV